MFTPTSFALAMVMMVTSTVCWGSWANTYKLTKQYRFELFYWDYMLGVVIVSFGLALTLGSTGGPESFVGNVSRADGGNIFWALVAGFIFNIANLLLVAAIEMAGLAVAFPLAIGIALVEGVVLSYALQPKGSALLLGIGVALAVVAVVADGKAYGSLNASRTATSTKGIVVCVVSGLLMGAFAPFVTRALTAGHSLGPYSVAVFFSLGALLCCFVVNPYFMKHPLIGEPVAFSGYFRQRGLDHLFGILGGCMWGVGGVFNFVAASFVGVAICTRSARPRPWSPRCGACSSGRNSAARTGRRRRT